MSWAKALVFAHPLKSVTLERSGPPPQSVEEQAAAVKAAYAAGFQAASDRFNAQILEMRQQMQQHAHGVLTELGTAHEALTAQMANALPELIVAGVYKIISEEISRPEVLKGRIEKLVTESCPPAEPVTVFLAQSDLDALRSLDENFVEGHSRLSFKADVALNAGDCRMLSKFGEIDAKLKTQLHRLMDEMVNT